VESPACNIYAHGVRLVVYTKKLTNMENL